MSKQNSLWQACSSRSDTSSDTESDVPIWGSPPQTKVSQTKISQTKISETEFLLKQLAICREASKAAVHKANIDILAARAIEQDAKVTLDKTTAEITACKK